MMVNDSWVGVDQIMHLEIGCLRHMTGVKSYLHKYVEQPGPKVVFGDDYTCTTKGYALSNVMFDEKRGTIFNSNKEIVMITPRVRDVYVLDMTSSTQESINTINIAKSERYPLDEYLHPYEPSQRWSQDKHIELVNIISNPGAGMLTRAMAKQLSATSAYECLFVDFLSEEETKKVSKALKHPGWVDVMQDKQNQFAKNKVWTLVPAPYGKTIIGSRWNALDYDETFAPVARLEAIRIFLAFATYMNFIVYHMDVKSAFLNGKLKEEVYVKQPPDDLDIQFSTCLCTRYQANPKESYLIAVKRIFRYLKGGKLVCWSAKKQQSVAMSSAEAEYEATTSCYVNILWMKSQITANDIIYEKVTIFCDNTSAIAISNNLVLHSRTKHIDIKYHFIRDHILKGDIELHFIPTQYQLADIFTKPLDEPTFKRLIVELGGLDQISNKDATILNCLANGVQVDYAKIIWEDLIHKLNKKTREKIVPYPRFISLLLKHMEPKYDTEELTINPTQAICNLDVHVDSIAPKYSSPTEEVPQGKKPGARSGLKRKKSSKHTPKSTTEASKP
ncbi:retrovirus-related pol polyprotein from transposon TNT 1-94 [Tanacetum coccineum]